MKKFPALLSLLVLCGQPLAAQTDDALVRTALRAAPDDLREGATVLSSDGTRTLKTGSNDLICLAPDPRAEAFSTSCYHDSLDPYMARGRALAREGIADPNERYRIRWEEADAGTLAMPDEPATLYVLYGPKSVWTPTTGDVEGASLRWVLYTPWATAESTGLSEVPVAGAPWLMFGGTAGAHVMIVPNLGPPPGR